MKNRKATIFYVTFLAIAIVIGCISTNLTEEVVRASTISDLARQQENVQNRLADIKREKEQLSSRSSTLSGELAWLNDRTQQERSEYEKLVEELEAAYLELDRAFKAATAAKENLINKQEEYKYRLRTMFENRNKTTLEMLLGATDLASFFANIRIIAIIAENDRKTIEELHAARDEAIIKRETAQKYSEDMELYVEEKNAEIEALKKQIDVKQDQISNVKSELSNIEREERELRAQSNRIADEIKRLQTTRSYYGGDMVWPVPGHSRITSPFGNRFLFGRWSMHNGIDVGAPFDTKIVAAADGKVIAVETIPGYNPRTGNNYGRGGGGYGNHLIIDHGGGISTVYAHCKLLRVSLGEDVKAGQWIADIGSTGISTGPHLHFEVRENGNPVNPMQKKYLGVR